MARLVTWAKADNTHQDPLVDARKFKLGMVVDILEDGQEAGKEIEAGTWWRIIEAPGPAKDYEYLLGGDPEFKDLKLFLGMNPLPRKRVQRLDLAAIETAAGLLGKSPERVIALTKSAVTLQAKTVESVANPLMIGEAPAIPVIG